MEIPRFDPDELYREVAERALDEGAFTPEEWSDLIDMVLQEKEEMGETHDDQELPAVKEQLRNRYEEFRAEIPEE